MSSEYLKSEARADRKASGAGSVEALRVTSRVWDRPVTMEHVAHAQGLFASLLSRDFVGCYAGAADAAARGEDIEPPEPHFAEPFAAPLEPDTRRTTWKPATPWKIEEMRQCSETLWADLTLRHPSLKHRVHASRGEESGYSLRVSFVAGAVPVRAAEIIDPAAGFPLPPGAYTAPGVVVRWGIGNCFRPYCTSALASPLAAFQPVAFALVGFAEAAARGGDAAAWEYCQHIEDVHARTRHHEREAGALHAR